MSPLKKVLSVQWIGLGVDLMIDSFNTMQISSLLALSMSEIIINNKTI